MICAYCKADIEHDSFFCDQCGEELLLCEKCGKPGKGKRCTNDGGKLVSAKDKAVVNTQQVSQASTFSGNVANQNPLQMPTNKPITSTVNNVNTSHNAVNQTNNNIGIDATQRVSNSTINASYATTVPGLNNSFASGIPQCVIINKAINATLQINNGDIIGRKTGNFINVFGQFNQISGKHAQFNYNNNTGWTLTDLGSSNGTKYQGQVLLPNIPVPIQDKSYIIFANIEFFVQIAAMQTNNISNMDSDRTFRL
ncbi:MAG TPA: FHA domain-containing protein [Melioribacteraceae bacterium]|nr:FHA domain-containing protein [Melioribacteraceae bacterium]